MKPASFFLRLLSALPFFIACGEFATSFEEVATNRVRTIDFVYRNVADTAICEAAPGDSLAVTAIFAGEKIRDIDLSVSFDVRTSLYGKTESSGSAPLDYSICRSTLRDTQATDADTFCFKFKIPGDMLTKAAFLPDRNWISVLPDGLRPLVPASIAAMSKSEVVSFLQRFATEVADTESSTGTVMPDSLRRTLYEQFPGGIETLLQLFSAQIELTALVNKQYTIVSYATVRFHRLFSHIDTAVVCNRNPVITRMGIYRVLRNNLTSFDPAINSQPYEEIILYDAATGVHLTGSTLPIRRNESYFFFVKGDPPQPVRTIANTEVYETHRCKWFYRQDFGTIDTVDASDRMSVINSTDGPVVPLITATSPAVSRCDLWVQLRDEAIGPRLYPTGSTVFNTSIFFDYSSEYLNQ